MWSLWNHNFILETENEDLPDYVEMKDARKYIPSRFGRPPRNIHKHWATFKAEEWKNWCIHYLILLRYGKLSDKHIMHYAKFVEAVKLCLKHQIKQTDLQTIEKI